MISTYVVYIRPNQSGNACFVFFFLSCYFNIIHPALHSVLDVRLRGGNLQFFSAVHVFSHMLSMGK